jgi:hypothetical protein
MDTILHSPFIHDERERVHKMRQVAQLEKSLQGKNREMEKLKHFYMGAKKKKRRNSSDDDDDSDSGRSRNRGRETVCCCLPAPWLLVDGVLTCGLKTCKCGMNCCVFSVMIVFFGTILAVAFWVAWTILGKWF